MKKIVAMLMVLSAVSFGLTVTNGNFDDDVISDGGWGGCPSGWSGSAARQNLAASNGLSPEAQSGDNVAILNEGDWITSGTLMDDADNAILVEANKIYQISLWVGRRGDDCGNYAGILKAWLSCASLEDGLGVKIDYATYDLEDNTLAGQWDYITFTLTTGAAPTYAGEALLLGFDNIGDRAGSSNWLAQVILDSVTITEVPEPATLLLAGLGAALLRKKK